MDFRNQYYTVQLKTKWFFQKASRFVYKFIRTYPRVAPGTTFLAILMTSAFIYQHHFIPMEVKSVTWFNTFAVSKQNLSIIQLISATITHNSLNHIGSNIAFLLFVGWIIEHYIPPVGYIITFFCGSAIGIFAFLLSGTARYGLGASAGVYFLLGFTLLYLGRPFIYRKINSYSIPIPSLYLLLTFGLLGITFLSTLFLPNEDVSHIAHFISFTSGLIFGVVTAPNSELEPFSFTYKRYTLLHNWFI